MHPVFLLNFEINTDLKNIHGRKADQFLNTGFILYFFKSGFDYFLGFGYKGKPYIKIPLPFIVVGDAGILINLFNKFRYSFHRDPGGTKGTCESQLAGIEIGSNAPDDPPLGHAVNTRDDLLFREVQPVRDLSIRSGLEREMGLNFIENSPIGPVQLMDQFLIEGFFLFISVQFSILFWPWAISVRKVTNKTLLPIAYCLPFRLISAKRLFFQIIPGGFKGPGPAAAANPKIFTMTTFA
jgi:hypothetical protein